MNEPVLFERLAPIPPAHPRAWFPMLPVLGRSGRAKAELGPQPTSRFLEADAAFTSSGAAAIHCALRDTGVGAGASVIVPAYHCPTMVFPVLAAGALPRFARVREDLSIGLAEIERCADAGTRAVLLPHFFGYAQPEIEAIAAWCRARGAALIEDCAHAFYGCDGGFVPGRAGDYAIASTRKFFAGTEGGALVANGRTLRARPPAPPLRAELHAVFDTLQLAAHAGNLAFGRRGAAASGARREGPPDEAASLLEAQARPMQPDELAASACARRATRSTVALIRGADHAHSAAVRRARWARWTDALRTVPSVRALREDPPDSGAPYVFPALLADPDRQFPALKRAGVQVWRWDRLARSDCPKSRRLALQLVQLPCPQSLDDHRFEALVEEFRARLVE